MPCRDAMIARLTTARSDQNVGEVLDSFEEKNIRSIPVVAADGTFEGLFTMQVVLKNLLPVAASMEDGLENLDFVIGATPGIAKRLKKLREKTVGEVMMKNCITLEPDTHTWEAVRVMKEHGSPIPIIDTDGKLVGMISTHSLMRELQRVLNQLETDKELDD